MRRSEAWAIGVSVALVATVVVAAICDANSGVPNDPGSDVRCARCPPPRCPGCASPNGAHRYTDWIDRLRGAVGETITNTGAAQLILSGTGKPSWQCWARWWCVWGTRTFAVHNRSESLGRLDARRHQRRAAGLQISGLSNAAGIGGGAFYVPLNHLVVGFGERARARGQQLARCPRPHPPHRHLGA